MMTPKKYDIVAVSALCLGIQVKADDEMLKKSALQKIFSNAVSAGKLKKLAQGDILSKAPGSPGCNVATGIVLRGGIAAIIGKVANDNNGTFVAERIAVNGVTYAPVISDKPKAVTTCVLALTTPDKERTFAFVDSAAGHLAPEDIDVSLIAKSKITYLDSFLWDTDSGANAVRFAAAEAKREGGVVAIALNEARLVARKREHYLALAQSHGDVLLGDQREFSQLFGTSTFEETVEAVHKLGCIAAITAGEMGAYIVDAKTVTFIPSIKVEKVVDTNGAGDAFAAGFLFGLAQGKSPCRCGRQGALWASEIIQHIGAEPKVDRKAPSITQKDKGLNS